MKLRYRPKAMADIRSIALRISEDSPMAAIRWRDGIRERCSLLADLPELGVSRQDVLSKLRVFPVGRYLILCRRVQGGVEILRIMHGARQWSSDIQR